MTEKKPPLLPVFAGLLFLVFSIGFLDAQDLSPTPAYDPFAHLLFKIAVFGPSDDIFIWWGHAGLIAGLALGAAGSVLFFASRVAERDYMRSNINLLFANPLALAVIPLGVIAALGGKAAARCLRVWWRYVCATCAASALLNVIPFLRQDNWPTVALVLPAALILSLPERAA